MNHLKTVLLLLGLVVLLIGCGIEESTPTPRGMLLISATDSTGADVTGASITLDGILQTTTTPALLGPVATGSHTIKLRKQRYLDLTQTVSVDAGDTARFTGTLALSPLGYLSVTSNPTGARIIFDEQYLLDSSGAILTTPTVAIVSVGNHTVTVVLDSHRTVSPALHRVNVAQDTTAIQFGLSFTQTGKSAGKLPISFRQRLLTNDTTRFDTLNSEIFRGHTTVFTCWFTTCVPCRNELPFFNTIYEEYAERGVRFVALTTPYPRSEPLASMQAAVREVGITFPVTIDPHPGYWMAMVENTNNGYPLNIVVDSTGAIHWAGGSVSETELRSMISTLVP
ncbi:MAG: PEGA domain-containing protein [bacterium]|nr:PEGA domain-containing protein [bacterium]